MRNRLFILTLVTSVLLSVTWAHAGSPIKMSAAGENNTSQKKQPRAVVAQTEYAFDPVFEGVQIKHDFVIENRGTVPLVIQNVRPD
jgi:hypothetical protein